MYNSELIADMRSHCNPANRESNTRLYQAMVAGDKPAREVLITDNMPLVVSLVNDYLQQHRHYAHLRDDLTSVGFLALVKASDGLLRAHDPIRDVTSYLAHSIRHALGKVHEPAVYADDSEPEARSEAEAQGEAVESRDVLDACCVTNLDKTISDLRVDGCTIREIAARTGRSPTSVKRRLRVIRERFSRKLKNLVTND